MQLNMQPNIFKKVFIRIFIRLVTAFACLGLVISLSACEQKIPDVLASPPGGWVAIRGEGVALSLPMGFVGGNPGRELAEIQDQLGAIDSDSEKKLRAVSQNPTAVALVAFDTQENDTQGNDTQGNLAYGTKISAATNVNITSQSLPKNADVQALLEMGAKQITGKSSEALGGYQILQQQVITLQEREIVKIIATTGIPEQNPQTQQLFYLVPDASHKKLWVITYTTLAQGFDRHLPIFEKSISTLQIFS